MAATNDFSTHPPRRVRKRRCRRGRDGARRHAIQGADRAAQDFRARARRVAWRLVLAAGVGLARAAATRCSRRR